MAVSLTIFEGQRRARICSTILRRSPREERGSEDQRLRTVDASPEHVTAALAEIHEEVREVREVRARYYGCGLVLPEALEGCRILGLGCGSGRDCYLLSKLVGPDGEIVGVDMTEAQLAVAQRHREYHRAQFGYPEPNVRFHLGRSTSCPLSPRASISSHLTVSSISARIRRLCWRVRIVH